MIHAEKLKIKTWLCYYGSTLDDQAFSSFDLMVLDGHYHPPLVKLAKNKPIILGYVSVGEVINNGPLWQHVKDKPYLICKNEFWDSWLVDVRDKLWQRFLFATVLPPIAEKGFDGFFIDTFDSALGLASSGEEIQLSDIKAALAKIVQSIKIKYPDKLIAVNRGLPVLPRVAEFIDFVVVEGLFSSYSAQTRDYSKVDPYTQNLLLQQLAEVLRTNPALTVLTLEYAANHQKEMIKAAILFSKKKGFVPYVSTFKLDKVFLHTLED